MSSPFASMRPEDFSPGNLTDGAGTVLRIGGLQ